MVRICILFISFFLAGSSFAQISLDSTLNDSSLNQKTKKFGGDPGLEVNSGQLYNVDDTTYFLKFDEFTFFDLRTFTLKKDQKKYNKLVANVKKVYPLAKLAAEKYQYYQELSADKGAEKKKEILKQVEDDLRAEYGKELRKLSPNQGRILLKLVDRETGVSSYEIVKEWKGGFTAWTYNVMAGLFKLNLKTRFNPDKSNEDLYIDEIVQMINVGRIELKADSSAAK